MKRQVWVAVPVVDNADGRYWHDFANEELARIFVGTSKQYEIHPAVIEWPARLQEFEPTPLRCVECGCDWQCNGEQAHYEECSQR